jgi:flagellar biogenesis protein FliO
MNSSLLVIGLIFVICLILAVVWITMKTPGGDGSDSGSSNHHYDDQDD